MPLDCGAHALNNNNPTSTLVGRGISVACKEFIQQKLTEDSEMTAKKVLIQLSKSKTIIIESKKLPTLRQVNN